MRFFSIGTLLSVFLCSMMQVMAQGGPRIVESIDDGWKFHTGGLEYAKDAGFDDASWNNVSLPHTWNAQDPFDDDETYVRGIGWYRRPLELDERFNDKKIYLFFEGANQVADVYVNGYFAGGHKGGYTGFTVDITPFINRKTGHNTIAVQVNNAHDPFIPPLSVGYALYGGIYRDVWLMATDDLHYAEINKGAGGVFVSTSKLSTDAASVAISSNITNESGRVRHFSFVGTVYDAHGVKVTERSQTYSAAPHASMPVSAFTVDVAHPHLWTPEDPYRYSVRTQIIEDGRVVDEVTNPLGFRSYRFDPDSGFILNGKKYILRGVNRHQDLLGKGSALSTEDHARDFQMIKDMGCNFVRLAHYPQAPAVLELADKLGIFIWEEVPVVDYMNIQPEFLRNAEQMLREMIHQHYDHPSIIIWGSMNEILLQSASGERIQKHVDDSLYVRGIHNYALRLDSTIRAEDPTRYTTMAMHESGDYAKYQLDNISQISGLNIYSGWYSGRVEDFGNSVDRQHRNNPGKIIFISEYGAEGEVQLNTAQPERMDYTGQYQRLYHEAYLRQIRQRPYLAGTAVWNEFDFSQPNIGGPTPHRNQKGLVTWDRHPKDVYYFYKANWNPEPMVYIATRDWPHRAGTESAATPIDVYTNLDAVTLYVNGKAQRTVKPDDVGKCSWQVVLQAGNNIITAIATRGRQRYEDHATVGYDAYPARFSANTIPPVISVNVGSNAQYCDPSGTVWVEDRAYTAGSFGYVGGNRQNFSRTKVIKNTGDVPLYYTARDSLQSYRFDVPDGNYRLTLCFVENRPSGARLFDVSVNGNLIVHNLDLANGYGYAQAMKKIFQVQAGQGRGITLSFQATKGNTTLSGIQLAPDALQ